MFVVFLETFVCLAWATWLFSYVITIILFKQFAQYVFVAVGLAWLFGYVITITLFRQFAQSGCQTLLWIVILDFYKTQNQAWYNLVSQRYIGLPSRSPHISIRISYQNP